MALQTELIDFDSEIDRLAEQMDELAEEQANWEGNEDHAQELLIRGNELNNQKNILAMLKEEWNIEGVKLRGLSAGQVNRVEDVSDSNDAVRERDAWVAIGTVEAPYLEHDPENVDAAAYSKTIHNVLDLPLPYVRWAEGKISELSHLSEATGNGYLDLVSAKTDEKQAVTNG